MRQYKLINLLIIIGSCCNSMELIPSNIKNFNNFTNNHSILPDNFHPYDKKLNELNGENWGFFRLSELINNPKHPMGINEYDLINGKDDVFLQQSTNPSMPTEVPPVGSTYWNGNTCFYSSGIPSSSVVSGIKPSYGKTFFGDSNRGNIKLIDPNSDKVYTFYSSKCNKKTCTTSNLNGIISANGFICPNAEATQLASNEKNTLWKNGFCFYKPVDFQKTSTFNCYYGSGSSSVSLAFNHYLDKQLKTDNTDDNFFCYPFISTSQNMQQADCVKEKLDLFFIDSNDFFIPKQLQSNFVWDGDYNRCFYYNGSEINTNKIFYYNNLPHMYSYNSNDISCNINNCTNNKVVPTANGFSCSLTQSISNLKIKKAMVSQGSTPSIPTEVAPAKSVYWNGNICFYSNEDPNNSLFSLIEQSYYKIYVDSSSMGAIDPNSDKLYTFISSLCNKKTCTKDNLNNSIITNNSFLCDGAENTQLALNEKNTVWKNSYCFHKPINFQSNSPFDCYYPDYLSTNNIKLNTVSETQLINNNIDDSFFCYPYISAKIEPQDCLKENLDLFLVNSNDFFIPKKFLQSTLAWDGDYNRCFYYDGVEINTNKIFYYGNLPHMYSYHSNDLSCNINNCKNSMMVSVNQNQFQCKNTTPTPPIPPSIPTIREYYPVNFAMIKNFVNIIGSLLKIPAMDTFHWGIYYPLMVILYHLSPWITFFVEPWINFANSMELFFAIKNQKFFINQF